MIDYVAQGIGPTCSAALTRVHALASRTDQVVTALTVGPTARLASVLTADLVVLAFVVVSAEKLTKS